MIRSPILVVDSDRESLKLLARVLEWAGFMEVRFASNAKEALAALSASLPHVLIFDLKLPDMDGYEFLKQAAEKGHNRSFMPIMVFTSELAPSAKIKALELGASDFLNKPGDAVEIQVRIRNFLRSRRAHSELQNYNQILEATVQQRTEHLVDARKETVELLAAASEYRDDDSGQHAIRVGEVSAALARFLGHDDLYIESMRMVAPLHDLGKLGVPDSILQKPGKLTVEEEARMRQHVVIGGELLQHVRSPHLQLAREIALYHHERWDGSGYAAGLKGWEIPESARIVAVADAFDAMTNDRPYRKAQSVAIALLELKAAAGTHFDPDIVDAAVALYGTSQHAATAA
jgi:putative two-component system response regulator